MIAFLRREQELFKFVSGYVSFVEVLGKILDFGPGLERILSHILHILSFKIIQIKYRAISQLINFNRMPFKKCKNVQVVIYMISFDLGWVFMLFKQPDDCSFQVLLGNQTFCCFLNLAVKQLKIIQIRLIIDETRFIVHHFVHNAEESLLRHMLVIFEEIPENFIKKFITVRATLLLKI